MAKLKLQNPAIYFNGERLAEVTTASVTTTDIAKAIAPLGRKLLGSRAKVTRLRSVITVTFPNWKPPPVVVSTAAQYRELFGDPVPPMFRDVERQEQEARQPVSVGALQHPMRGGR